MRTTLLNYFLKNQVELSYDYTIKFNPSTYCLDNAGSQKHKVYKVSIEQCMHLEYSFLEIKTKSK